MPLEEVREDYDSPIETEESKLRSDVADCNNIGGRDAGSITAALFLRKFIDPKIRWAHLDIAGTAMGGSFTSSTPTGRCVPLLVEYLKITIDS